MIEFQATIKKFQSKGEKTGWTYISVPKDITGQLLPGNKKSIRVKGKLDNFIYQQLALTPMGDGEFIMALNAVVRKGIEKQVGDRLTCYIQLDTDIPPISSTLLCCLEDDPKAKEFFQNLPYGHQRYFSNWIETAKTLTTKEKRITQAVIALSNGLGYNEMVKMNKKQAQF